MGTFKVGYIYSKGVLYEKQFNIYMVWVFLSLRSPFPNKLNLSELKEAVLKKKSACLLRKQDPENCQW